jgi:hypothetical protein
MSLKLGDLRAERGALIDAMSAMTESRDFDPAKFAESEANLGSSKAISRRLSARRRGRHRWQSRRAPPLSAASATTAAR